jgi:HK97 family phage prohead protease
MTTLPLEKRYRDMTSAGVQLRADEGAGTVAFSGYATVYDVAYEVAGGPPYGWYEIVVAGAGANTLKRKPDVRLLINHDGLPLARTSKGTMQLEEHDVGLWVDAPTLDLRNPRVQELRSTMEREDVDEMSYAFRVIRQEWNGDYTERRILEYDLAVKGSDVSVVTYPANEFTVAQMRDAVKIDELRSAARPAATLDVRMARALADRFRVAV